MAEWTMNGLPFSFGTSFSNQLSLYENYHKVQRRNDVLLGNVAMSGMPTRTFTKHLGTDCREYEIASASKSFNSSQCIVLRYEDKQKLMTVMFYGGYRKKIWRRGWIIVCSKKRKQNHRFNCGKKDHEMASSIYRRRLLNLFALSEITRIIARC